jgi:ribosomal RNA-processing protein 7
MPKEPLEISGYTVLLLQFPTVPSFPVDATHFLYLRQHEPRIPDADSPRSLFLVNIPVDTTETHLRHLFSVQLSAGRVERVEFQDVPTKKRTAAFVAGRAPGSKKRKRITADEIQNELEDLKLPPTWDRQVHKSGSHAIVVFVDKASMAVSLKAARKASKLGTKIVWGEGTENKLPPLGAERYRTHESLRYPPQAELLRIVNNYMEIFAEGEKARAEEAARKAQEPDEDGFVTVTRGPKNNNVVREDAVKELVEKQKQRDAGYDDFYRFQTREKKKEKHRELLNKFEDDKKKLEALKKRKGKIGVRPILFFSISFLLHVALN